MPRRPANRRADLGCHCRPARIPRRPGGAGGLSRKAPTGLDAHRLRSSSRAQPQRAARMFERISIANRGETACRIIDTCRRLGVESVAVYSDADANARHVRRADHAIHIGPAEADQSYLNIDRIVRAAVDSGAEAVHPGYGFLADNADFACAVDKAGLTLIGPSAKTMDIMGSKAAAKKHMETAGVPLIPGYHGDDQDDEVLLEKAAETGFR